MDGDDYAILLTITGTIWKHVWHWRTWNTHRRVEGIWLQL